MTTPSGPAMPGEIETHMEALRGLVHAAMGEGIKLQYDAVGAASTAVLAALAQRERETVDSCVEWLRNYADTARQLKMDMPVNISVEANFLADELAKLRALASPAPEG